MNFSVDFGMNALHAFILGDLLNAVQRRLQPYEKQAGTTARAVARAADSIAEHFRTYRSFELENIIPSFLRPRKESPWYWLPNNLRKIWSHLYGSVMTGIVPSAAREFEQVEVDWLQVKPVVKVIGEFWAQMTESDGNFQMLDFLEREGAEVSIEPISTWVFYLLQQKSESAARRQRLHAHNARWTAPGKALFATMSCVGQRVGLNLGSKIYLHHFSRLAALLGVPDLRPAPQATLAKLARPHYNTSLRGGEGHLEVGKTLYFTRQKSCHLVLALKPFGCLPSVQSDGVQASLVERFPEVNFLPIETSADGEIHAYSRVQMALSEARAKSGHWSLSRCSNRRVTRSKRSVRSWRSTRSCATPSTHPAPSRNHIHCRKLSVYAGPHHVLRACPGTRFGSASEEHTRGSSALDQIRSTRRLKLMSDLPRSTPQPRFLPTDWIAALNEELMQGQRPQVPLPPEA